MFHPHRFRRSIQAAGLLAVLAVVAGAYRPYFHTFVGTDLGVYWEVSRRLYTDGRLSLGENYWDHKPPAVYLALLPFQAVRSPAMEFLGLKIGTLAIYAACFALATWAVLLNIPGRSVGRVAGVCGVMALIASYVLDANLDPAQNGILAVAALCFEAAGLAVLAAAVRTPGRIGLGVLAGFLLASAPFWRPTSVVGGLILTLTAAWPLVEIARSRPAPEWRGTAWAGLVAAGITTMAWLGVIVALGTPLPEFVATVVGFNLKYGAYFRALTPIGEFFRQESTSYWLFQWGWLLFFLLAAAPRTRRCAGGRLGTGIAIAAFGYAALAVLLGVQSRKVQSFYVFQYVLPVLFALAFSVAVSSPRGKRLVLLVTAASWAGCGLLLYRSYVVLRPLLTSNDFASNSRMQTGAIASTLGSIAAKSPGHSRLWVYGNRAPLYAQAAIKGIRPYDWTVYDTALFAIGREKFDLWWAAFSNDPPEFIVRLNNAQTTPWEAAEESASRAQRINGLIDRRYEVLPTPAGTQSTWPYGYSFTVLHRMR